MVCRPHEACSNTYAARMPYRSEHHDDFFFLAELRLAYLASVPENRDATVRMLRRAAVSVIILGVTGSMLLRVVPWPRVQSRCGTGSRTAAS